MRSDGGWRYPPGMDQPSTASGQVDVTYVKRGQLAVITRLRTEPSQRAQDALARVAARRSGR
jgi:hypothetical protein